MWPTAAAPWNASLPLFEAGVVIDQSSLLGAVRLRQLRSNAAADCGAVVPHLMSSIVARCDVMFSAASQSTAPFGPGGRYKWTAGGKDDAVTLGELYDYPSGGFSVLLPGRNLTAVTDTIKQLRADVWIDSHTRAVVVESATYNAWSNRVLPVRLLVEFPPTGGAIPSWQHWGFQLRRADAQSESLARGLEVALAVVAFVYLVGELKDARKSLLEYLRSGWNAYDWLTLLMFAAWVAVCVLREKALDALAIRSDPRAYVDVDAAAYYSVAAARILAINVTLCWLKTLKYMVLIPRFGPIVRAIAGSIVAAKTLAFLAILAFVSLSFALGFNLAFARLGAFRSLSRALFSLFGIALGDIDLGALESVDVSMGRGAFLAAALAVTVVLMNIFIALISEVYDSALSAAMVDWETELDDAMAAWVVQDDRFPLVSPTRASRELLAAPLRFPLYCGLCALRLLWAAAVVAPLALTALALEAALAVPYYLLWVCLGAPLRVCLARATRRSYRPPMFQFFASRGCDSALRRPWLAHGCWAALALRAAVLLLLQAVLFAIAVPPLVLFFVLCGSRLGGIFAQPRGDDRGAATNAWHIFKESGTVFQKMWTKFSKAAVETCPGLGSVEPVSWWRPALGGRGYAALVPRTRTEALLGPAPLGAHITLSGGLPATAGRQGAKAVAAAAAAAVEAEVGDGALLAAVDARLRPLQQQLRELAASKGV